MTYNERIDHIRDLIKKEMADKPIRDVVVFEYLLEELKGDIKHELFDDKYKMEDAVELIERRIKVYNIELTWNEDDEVKKGQIDGLQEAIKIIEMLIGENNGTNDEA